jgi:hypothetical protein
LQAAAVTMAGGSFASGFSSVIGGVGWTSGFDLAGMASGGISPGGWTKVGERGPEIVNLPRGSQVIPNDRMGNVININMSVPGNTSRATADQIALATGAAVRRAMRSIG